MASLWEALAYGLGIFPVKQLKYVETDDNNIFARVRAHGRVSPYICAARNPGFGQRGIAGETKSWTQHCGLAVPRESAERVRKNHPDLMRTRKLPGSIPRADGYTWPLPPVPPCKHDVEVIESQKLVALNDFKAAIRTEEQAVVFLRDWTPEQEDAILYAAYYLYGAPYDVPEFLGHIMPFPNPKGLKVCSSFVGHALRGRDPIKPGADWGDDRIKSFMIRHGVDIEKCTPSNIGIYLFSSPLYHAALPVHCDLTEAIEKV